MQLQDRNTWPTRCFPGKVHLATTSLGGKRELPLADAPASKWARRNGGLWLAGNA